MLAANLANSRQLPSRQPPAASGQSLDAAQWEEQQWHINEMFV